MSASTCPTDMDWWMGQNPCQRLISLDGFFDAAYLPRFASGTKRTFSASRPETMPTALDEVQQTSISALHAAVELT